MNSKLSLGQFPSDNEGGSFRQSGFTSLTNRGTLAQKQQFSDSDDDDEEQDIVNLKHDDSSQKQSLLHKQSSQQSSKEQQILQEKQSLMYDKYMGDPLNNTIQENNLEASFSGKQSIQQQSQKQSANNSLLQNDNDSLINTFADRASYQQNIQQMKYQSQKQSINSQNNSQQSEVQFQQLQQKQQLEQQYQKQLQQRLSQPQNQQSQQQELDHQNMSKQDYYNKYYKQTPNPEEQAIIKSQESNQSDYPKNNSINQYKQSQQQQQPSNLSTIQNTQQNYSDDSLISVSKFRESTQIHDSNNFNQKNTNGIPEQQILNTQQMMNTKPNYDQQYSQRNSTIQQNQLIDSGKLLNTLQQQTSQRQTISNQNMVESVYTSQQAQTENQKSNQNLFQDNQQQQKQQQRQQTYNPQSINQSQNSNFNQHQNQRQAQTLQENSQIQNEHQKLVGLNMQRRIQSKIDRNRESIDIMRESFGISRISEKQKQFQFQQNNTQSQIENQNQISTSLQRNTQNNSLISQNNSSMGNGQPLQLIKCDGDKFLMNQKALQLINQSKTKVGFISIIGKYRTGKSFLMNKLLQNPPGQGFSVDSSVKSQTKGIWMWSKPIYCGNQDMNLYFIDTEGTGSVEQEKSIRDGQITALAILLSSYVIFNSVGCIDEQSISQLSYITQISKLITQNSDGEGQRSSVLSRQSHISSAQDDLVKQYDWPNFLWLLRDFTLEITDQMGNQISSTEYLEKCLVEQKPISNNPQSQESQEQFVLNKKVRQIITKVFKNRDCMTIVRPVEQEQELFNLENIPFTSYRQQFQKDLIFLREKILEEAQPKRINGVPLTPRMFSNLIDKYIQTLNNNGFLPNINTTWEHIIQQECENGYQKALNHYNKLFINQFGSEFVFTIKDLNKILTEIKQDAYVVFEETSQVKDKNIFFNSYRQKLVKYCEQKEEEIYKINDQYCQNYNLNLFNKAMQTIKINSNKDIYQLQNIDQFNDELKTAINKYNSECINLNELKPIVDFFIQDFPNIINNIQQNSKLQLEKGKEFMDQKKKIFGDIEDSYQTNIKMLEEQIKLDESRFEKLNQENAYLKQEDLKKMELLVEKDERIKELEEELNNATQTNEKKQRELNSVRDKYRQKNLQEKKGCCEIF